MFPDPKAVSSNDLQYYPTVCRSVELTVVWFCYSTGSTVYPTPIISFPHTGSTSTLLYHSTSTHFLRCLYSALFGFCTSVEQHAAATTTRWWWWLFSLPSLLSFFMDSPVCLDSGSCWIPQQSTRTSGHPPPRNGDYTCSSSRKGRLNR